MTYLDRVAMVLAGGVAERMHLGEHSIGVSGDVEQAKHIIEQMVDTRNASGWFYA